MLSDLVPVRQRNDGKPFTTIVGKWLKCIPKPVAILTYNDEVPVLKLVERQSTNIMPVDDPHLDHAFKLLVADIAHPPSVSELAETVGISRSTLDRLFLRKLGRPQHDEL